MHSGDNTGEATAILPVIKSNTQYSPIFLFSKCISSFNIAENVGDTVI